jgi:cystathionine beta-lyase
MKWDEHGGSPEAVGFESGKPYIPLWVADMDFRTAPAIIEALKRRVEHGAFGYTLVPDSYYDAVISWFRRRHQWTIERDWIQYTSGVVPALSVIVKAFTHPGDSVIVQTPVYNCFFSSIRNNGCEVVANPLRQVEHETPQNSQEEWDVSQSLHYEMDFDDLEAKARSPRAKLLILCNPHNPVGRTWTEAELRRVYMICKDNGVTVVSDEIHNELTYRGLRYAPYGDVCRMDNAIICTSPSKSFNTAGLQIANIICADPSWRQRIDRAINQNEVCDVNPFGVAALQAAYDESEDWLDQLCEYIYQNYEALCHFLRSQLPQLRVTPLEGTYLVWVDIRKLGISSDEMGEKLLREENVEVNVGTMYDPEGGKDFIRLNIACPRAQLMEGLERIKCFCERHF